jgi:molybdate transport system ATP-binding protein
VRAPSLRAEVSAELREFELAVELEVGPGACLALVGPSGAGKSTVLRAIAGLHRPERGRVSLDGEVWLDTAAAIDLPAERRNCGYLFQDYALFPHLSAWRNVAFGLDRLPRPERRGVARSFLERLGVGHLADASTSELSGGERQRIALARALAREPSVLLLDEPLAALDARTSTGAARELAATLVAADAPAVLVTHEFAEAALLADEVAVIDRGRIVQRGTPGELSARPASAFVAEFAGAAVLFGEARAEAGETVIALDGGGTLTSTDVARGPVGLAIYPWEVTLEPPGTSEHGSARNRLEARVTSVTEVGNRARIGLLAGQPFAAEVTGESAGRLGLEPGVAVTATFKATATRLVER